MTRTRPPLAAALVLALAAVPARANPSLSSDFANMSQWLSDEMAQGLAFNAGETFDPPKEVKGYSLQPDVSLGVGKIPLDKRTFPTLQVQALQDEGGSNLFPSSVLFPNFALHLRMGLPWRGDFYVRVADATTPPGYKISPTMTAKVQTNSFGFGVRQFFFGGDDMPTLTLGAHYNHVQGYTKLKGVFDINTNGLSQGDGFTGDIKWDVSSFGLTAIASESYGHWTPYGGVGYNYTTGSVAVDLQLQASQVNSMVYGAGSDRPEKSEGREIAGFSYDRPTWSAFMSAELKALGQLQYRSYIIDTGVALPFDIGRGPAIFYKKRPSDSASAPLGGDDSPPPPPAPKPRRKTAPNDDAPAPAPRPGAKPKPAPAPTSQQAPDMIFLQ